MREDDEPIPDCPRCGRSEEVIRQKKGAKFKRDGYFCLGCLKEFGGKKRRGEYHHRMPDGKEVRVR